MTYLPFLVLPVTPPLAGVRNFRTEQLALAYGRVLSDRRRIAVAVWHRTAAGVRLVRRFNPRRPERNHS